MNGQGRDDDPLFLHHPSMMTDVDERVLHGLDPLSILSSPCGLMSMQSWTRDVGGNVWLTEMERPAVKSRTASCSLIGPGASDVVAGEDVGCFRPQTKQRSVQFDI